MGSVCPGSTCGRDLVEERGLGRGLGLHWALSGSGGCSHPAASFRSGWPLLQAGAQSRGCSVPVGRIRPWTQALRTQRQQWGGTWHAGLPGRPPHRGQWPPVPVPQDLLAQAARASSIGCQHRGRQNAHRYGVLRGGHVGWHNPARGWGWFLGSRVAAASREWAECGWQPRLWWELGASGVCLYAWVCVSTRLRHGGRAEECVTTIWGRPRGPARAEPASPGCCRGW